MLNPFELEMRRREFLKAFGALAGLATIGGAVLPGCAPAVRSPVGALKALSEGEATLFVSLFPHFVPTGAEAALPVPAAPSGWLPAVDNLVAATEPAFRKLFHILCALFEHQPVLSRNFSRFTRLPPAKQAAIVSDWAASPSALKSSGYQLFRTLVVLGAYSQPEVYRSLGYVMPCGPAPRPRPQGLVTGAEAAGTIREVADVAVVGSGAGGAMVAALLAEAGQKVVLIESGSYYDASHFTGSVPEIWSKTYAQQGLAMMEGDPPVVLFYGDSVGGSTTVNLGTCYRTPDHVLRRWASEEGLTGLSAETMAPYFAETERAIHSEETSWAVIGEREKVLHDGAKKLGWNHRRLNRNTLGCVGCGRCLLGCPVNAKQSTLVSLVPRAGAAGAKIFSDARVTHVVIEGGVAVGLEASIRDPATRLPKAALSVRAKRIVLAAGALGTPQILLRTGLGDHHTGSHLRVHPASGCLGVFPKRLNDRLGAPQAFGVEQFNDEGIMLETFFGPPDLFAALAPGHGAAHNEILSRYPNASVLIFFLAEKNSEGSVRPGSGGATVLKYNLTEDDAATALRAFELVCELLFASGAERVLIPVGGMHVVRSLGEAKSVLASVGRRQNLRLNGFHPMGSARMGADPARSVVGPDGQHHRVRNLYVADGSLFPTALGVNPQVSIMSFAAKIARGLLAA